MLSKYDGVWINILCSIFYLPPFDDFYDIIVITSSISYESVAEFSQVFGEVLYLWNAWRTKTFHSLHDPIYFDSSIIQAENGTVAMHEESV